MSFFEASVYLAHIVFTLNPRHIYTVTEHNLLHYPFAPRDPDRLIECPPRGDVYTACDYKAAMRTAAKWCTRKYGDMLIENRKRQIQMRR